MQYLWLAAAAAAAAAKKSRLSLNMGRMRTPQWLVLQIVMLVISSSSPAAFAQLSTTFYAKSCPGLASIVNGVVAKAVKAEPRMAASLLRLQFHDCFVNGCDGSILLDDTSTLKSEKNALPNQKSVRGFEVIDEIKKQVELQCKNVVSCADIVASAAREGVSIIGGPKWAVQYGRRDSTTASVSTANSDLPSFSETAQQLTAKFSAKGFSAKELVVLSGAHTIGHSRCVLFRDRIYNFSGSGAADGNLQLSYRVALTQQCPGKDHDHSISPLDPSTPTTFDNIYFKLLQVNRGLLNSDQVLYSTSGATQDAVNTYSKSRATFFQDFADAMVKMGNIGPLTGTKGQIRRNCRAINASPSKRNKSSP